MAEVNGDGAPDIVTAVFGAGRVVIVMNQCAGAGFQASDAVAALREAGGLSASGVLTDRYDLDHSGAVSLTDAVRIARKSQGLDPNP